MSMSQIFDYVSAMEHAKSNEAEEQQIMQRFSTLYGVSQETLSEIRTYVALAG
jgi:hypothetical protein